MTYLEFLDQIELILQSIGYSESEIARSMYTNHVQLADYYRVGFSPEFTVKEVIL